MLPGTSPSDSPERMAPAGLRRGRRGCSHNCLHIFRRQLVRTFFLLGIMLIEITRRVHRSWTFRGEHLHILAPSHLLLPLLRSLIVCIGFGGQRLRSGEPVCLPIFNKDEENRLERRDRHRVRCFVLFSLCSAVAGELFGRGKQSLKRALNSGPESILPGLNFGEESCQSSANLAMQRNQWNFSLALINSTWHYAAAVERYSELRNRVSKPAFAA